MLLFMFESFVLYKWGVQIIILSCSVATNDIYRIHLHTCMYVGTFAHLFHFMHQASIEFTQCSYSSFYTYALSNSSSSSSSLSIAIFYHNKYHYHHVLITTIIILDIIILTIFYYTEGVFTSSGRTGCIYSTLFDAHIIFMLSRQYHINCLSIQNTYNFIYAYIFDIWPSVPH